MKPSAIFDRWMKANAERLTNETEEFKHLVAGVSFYLTMMEANRNGFAPSIADAITAHFAKFQAALAERDIERPDITLPKLKIVQPKPRGAR
jgi:hypothetical protein